MKKFLPVAILLILSACTQIPVNTADSSSSSSSAVSETVTSSSVASFESGTTMSGSLRTFIDSVRQYTINYPSDFTIVANDNLTTEDYAVTGTSFVFPDSYAAGNTLNEAKVSAAVQPTCPTLTGATTTGIVVRNGVSFSTADWSGVGAGNLYQGRTYTTVHDNSCYILTLYMHSCNLGPDCYAGHTTPFNKDPLTNVFEKMVNTFAFLP